MIVDVSVDIGRNIIGHWNVFIEILDSCANVMGEFHVGRRFFASEERTHSHNLDIKMTTSTDSLHHNFCDRTLKKFI